MAAAGTEVISAIHFYHVILSIKWRVFWSGLAAAVFKNLKTGTKNLNDKLWILNPNNKQKQNMEANLNKLVPLI